MGDRTLVGKGRSLFPRVKLNKGDRVKQGKNSRDAYPINKCCSNEEIIHL